MMEFRSLSVESSMDIVFKTLVKEFGVKNCIWLSRNLIAKLPRISKENWFTIESLAVHEHTLFPFQNEDQRLWIWENAVNAKKIITLNYSAMELNYTFYPLQHPDTNEILGLVVFENHGLDLLGIQEMLRQTARHVSFCMEYFEAKSLSYVDDLTSLYNQRYLPQVLGQEIDRCHRKAQKFSLLFLDIDYFKRVNDGHGHLIGSQLLVEVAQIIKNTIRSYDPLFRYGGDEFLALLVDTDKGTGEKVAERIRRAIEAHEFEAAGKNLKLTASIGLSVFPDHAKTATDLIQLADQAMYYGKNKSRNIVYIAS